MVKSKFFIGFIALAMLVIPKIIYADTLTTVESYISTDVALNSGFVTCTSVSLTAGTWLVNATATIYGTGTQKVEARLYNTTDSALLSATGESTSSATPGASLTLSKIITITGTKTIALQGYSSSGLSSCLEDTFDNTQNNATGITATLLDFTDDEGSGSGEETDMTEQVINELFGLILVIGAIISFLIAFFIGKSLVKRR